MVKRHSAFAKNNRREVRKTLSRYLAILAIIALGVGFFSGVRVTREAMVASGNHYLQRQNFYDFRLISTLGLTEEDEAYFASLDGVACADGSISTDFLLLSGSGTESAWKALSISEINAPQLTAGRLPEAADECLADKLFYSESALGTAIKISDNNSDSVRDLFRYEEYTVVGLCDSPLYLNFERGTTSLGDGTLSGFFYFPAEGLDSEVFTEIYVTMEQQGDIFSEEYDANRDAMEPVLKKALEERADKRSRDLAEEAQGSYDEAYGDYLKERKKAEGELNAAAAELEEAKAQLEDARREIEDGEKKLESGRQQYSSGLKEYNDGVKQLEEKKTEVYAELDDYQSQLNDGIRQAETARNALAVVPTVAQYLQLPGQISSLESRLAETQEGSLTYYAISAELELARRTLATLEEGPIVGQYKTAAAALSDLYAKQNELNASRAQADSEFSAAQAELDAAKKKLSSAAATLSSNSKKLADGKQEYQDGLEKYSSGLKEYEDGRREADEKFAEAEEEFADARRQIRELRNPTTYTLDRSTNTGYVCFDSDSQIVFGVSKVFPIFFFLVAALVCVTTMTRMVDEQRTQIGTLKALGYSNGKIIWKYVSYSGSAATAGCILGFFVGSNLFPTVIWYGYSLLYGYGKIEIVYNWTLGIISLIVSLACSAGATYLACRQDLHQVPAELMRPKAPSAGKRILLERIGFIWKRLSFLHKVTARNIFRYTKRLIMMVLGIGGCTALVITGLGLRDSICNIAEDQFGKIQKYDLGITFSGGAEPEERLSFAEDHNDLLDECVLVCSSSSDASCGGSLCSVNILTCSDERLYDMVELRNNGSQVALPADGSIVISSNLAEKGDIGPGDTLTLLDNGVPFAELPVSGVFDNYVYSYVLMDEHTYASLYGEEAEYNTVFANIGEGEEHEVAASLMNDRCVAGVSVMSDFRARISNMLLSMDYIVALVIGSAAALAFVVLFNLSNINLTERAREIATIKVLGFYPAEAGAYVFRENIVLTLLGAILGLPLGKALHAFVMSQIKLDIIAFDTRVTWLSYVLSVVLTFVFTFLVDLIMRRKLNAIDMAESLKSIE